MAVGIFQDVDISVTLQEIHGRSITFLCHDGKVHALDSNCYHMGGPLGEGDIEELASGHLCIVCPWHKYRVRHLSQK